MHKILDKREEIYNIINGPPYSDWLNEAAASDDGRFRIYCNAKDTIQDTAEAVLHHREIGFAQDTYAKYLEYYGVLQAVYMQQDAIISLYKLFLGNEPNYNEMPNWKKLRDLRNTTVGHPVGRRTLLVRDHIQYDDVWYLHWPQRNWNSKHIHVNLGKLLDSYDAEASACLQNVRNNLPKNSSSSS